MLALPLILAGAVVLAADTHSTTNPVFAYLVEKGVSPGGEKSFPLPTPLMPDGLDAAAQRKIIEELIGRRYSFDQFTQNRTVAPHIPQVESRASGDPKTPLATVDLYFVGYGDMDTMTNKNFLRDAFQENRQDEQGEAASLTPEELAQRNIEIDPAMKERENYGRTTFELLNRVELSVVGHSCWSRTEDSVATAAMIDPRFHGDAEYPNVWRLLTRTPAGKLQKGPPQPYAGGGVYMKITRLAQPQGAVFVEVHLLAAEPHAWFEGRSTLRAKIPTMTPQKVKEMRQEMLRAQPAGK